MNFVEYGQKSSFHREECKLFIQPFEGDICERAHILHVNKLYIVATKRKQALEIYQMYF